MLNGFRGSRVPLVANRSGTDCQSVGFPIAPRVAADRRGPEVLLSEKYQVDGMRLLRASDYLLWHGTVALLSSGAGGVAFFNTGAGPVEVPTPTASTRNPPGQQPAVPSSVVSRRSTK